MTPFQRHLTQWQNCERCKLCHERKHTALYRGAIPCEVLFIGEGPGASEDALAKPFCGPAGHLLDKIIKEALYHYFTTDDPPTIGFTNLIACIPERNETGKIGEPTEESIRACSPRLREIVALAKPKLIVLVGKHAIAWVKKLLMENNDGQRTVGASRSVVKGAKGGSKTKALQLPVASLPYAKIRYVELIHPSAILQADVSQQGLYYQRSVVTLADAFSELSELYQNSRRF